MYSEIRCSVLKMSIRSSVVQIFYVLMGSLSLFVFV